MVGFFRIVLFFTFLNFGFCDSCEPNHGTEGIYDCVQIPKYDGYQWAICLSSQSMETQTSRQKYCQGSLFCWLPCAQSIYPNSKSGHIPKECKCDPDENERRKRSLIAKGSESKVNVPPVCYIPAWTNKCNWYSECLEAHSPCEGSNFYYAISYGEAICSIFLKSYNSFSEVGKNWIRSSQKCIQDSMRSFYMPNNTAKCKDIRDRAYQIHSHCYIQRSYSQFCKLFGPDQLKIYWSIKQFYEHAFPEKFDEGMARFRSCLQNDVNQELRKFMFYVEKNVGNYVDENTFASRMAETFNFSSHGLDWDVDKTFSSKHKQFYKSQEYQVIKMFLSKRRVKVIKRRKRHSYRHLLDAADSEYDSKFMDNFPTEITNRLHLNVLTEAFENQAKLVGMAEEKSSQVVCQYIAQSFVFMQKKCQPAIDVGTLPGTPRSIDTKFYLYNRGGNSIQMKLSDKSSLKQFDPNKKTFVIIHGFLSNGGASWVLDLRDILLIKEDANVIVVDWRGGANIPLYPYAAANTQLVGIFLALLVSSLKHYRSATNTYFHIIGHSLGAHAAGFAGKAIKDRKLDRITGLDPAGPCFKGRHENARLDRSDAEFVDVIHTDGGTVRDEQGHDIKASGGCDDSSMDLLLDTFLGLGYRRPMGHVDFYPNGGTYQPGCIKVPCSHSSAYDLFTRSILSDERFEAWECASLDECRAGKIIDQNPYGRNRMGYHATKVKPSKMYYLETTKISIISFLSEKIENIFQKFVVDNFCRFLREIFHRHSKDIYQSMNYCGL